MEKKSFFISETKEEIKKIIETTPLQGVSNLILQWSRTPRKKSISLIKSATCPLENYEKVSLDVKKEDILLSEKDSEALRVLFNFSVKYSNQDEEAEKKSGEKSENNGEVSFKGFFILTVSNEEAKAILKDWKKQEISEFIRVPLFNFILRRCSVRAMQLEEELGLPLHVPLPQISAPQTSETKKE